MDNTHSRINEQELVQELSGREMEEITGGHSLWEVIKTEIQWQAKYGIFS